jgi:DMSO reductase anchor subunit
VATLTLVGTAAGLYIVGTLLSLVRGAGGPAKAPWQFKLLSAALASAGFLMLLFEAGRPLRGRFLLRGVGHSWMSREVLAGAVFIVTAVLDWRLSVSWLWALATAAAVALIISQGFLLHRGVGVCSWNRAAAPLLYVASALALGGGFALMLAWAERTASAGLLAICLGAVGADLAVWCCYLRSVGDEAFCAPAFVSRQRVPRAFITGLGHLVPLVLLLAGLVAPAEGRVIVWIAGLAGLCIILGGLALKVYLLRAVAYLRELSLVAEATQGEGART